MKKYVLGLLILVGATGFAKLKKQDAVPSSTKYFKQVQKWPSNPGQWLSETKWLDPSSYDQAKVAPKVSDRKLANSGKEQSWYEGKMTTPYKEARKKFLALKSPAEMDAMIKELDKNYDTYPTDLKYFAAQVIPLQTMRGIVWKMIPAVKDYKIMHSMLLTQVRQWVVSQKIFFPSDHWDVGIAYVTTPYLKSDESLAVQFENEADIQGYMGSVVYPVLRESVNRIAKLDMTSNEIVWDNQMLFGSNSFTESIDRYRLMGEVERRSTLSSLTGALAQVAMFRAYSVEGAFRLNSEIGREYGLDSLLTRVDGVPAQKIRNIIRSGKYPNWGVAMDDNEKWMGLAYNNLMESVIHAQWALQESYKRPASEDFFTDTSSTVPYYRPFKYRMDNMYSMLQGEKELHSAINGEGVKVNLKNYFIGEHRPKDLKLFYADSFNEEKDMKPFVVKGRKLTEYRNYEHGRPMDWKNINVFKPYFPDVKSGEDLFKAARIVSQSWAGSAVVAPLLTYIQ